MFFADRFSHVTFFSSKSNRNESKTAGKYLALFSCPFLFLLH